VETARFEIETGERLVHDITDRVTEFARRASGGGDGLLHVFLPHATCGLALIETGSGSEADLAEAVERQLPREDVYRHRHGSVGHGGDHLVPAFISPSLILPVEAGRVALGTWQSVVLVDPNRDNPVRTVRLALLPG
jgi:secondary thiamine-phosphate synthase enzyme